MTRTQRQQRRLCTQIYHCCGPRAVLRRISRAEKTSSTHKYVKQKNFRREREKRKKRSIIMAKVNEKLNKERPHEYE